MVDHTTIPTTGNLPLISILRGIQTAEVSDVCDVLCGAGIEYIEIPLNSPKALDSIECLAKEFSNRAVCGAGTVVSSDQVDAVVSRGAKLIVSPNTDSAVIEAAIQQDAMCLPGVATVSEAFSAINSGAKQLKLFPAGDLGPGYLKSIAAVVPSDIPIIAVGNIGEQDLETFYLAGARGFGIGGALYKPGISLDLLGKRAAGFVKSAAALRG